MFGLVEFVLFLNLVVWLFCRKFDCVVEINFIIRFLLGISNNFEAILSKKLGAFCCFFSKIILLSYFFLFMF